MYCMAIDMSVKTLVYNVYIWIQASFQLCSTQYNQEENQSFELYRLQFHRSSISDYFQKNNMVSLWKPNLLSQKRIQCRFLATLNDKRLISTHMKNCPADVLVPTFDPYSRKFWSRVVSILNTLDTAKQCRHFLHIGQKERKEFHGIQRIILTQ